MDNFKFIIYPHYINFIYHILYTTIKMSYSLLIIFFVEFIHARFTLYITRPHIILLCNAVLRSSHEHTLLKSTMPINMIFWTGLRIN